MKHNCITNLLHRQLLFFIALFTFQLSIAQDIIEVNSGDKILAKVINVGDEEIKYKFHDNIMGPMQSIARKEVIRIIFNNGTVKVIGDLTLLNKKIKDPEKFKVRKHNQAVTWEYQFDMEDIFSGDTIYYYGIDMSNLVYSNAEKAAKDNSLRNYISSWYYKFNDVITIDLIKRGLQTIRVQSSDESIQNSFDSVRVDWIKPNWEGMSIEEIINIVYELPTYTGKQSGVGFLIMADTFDHASDNASLIFTFFDVISRKLLWVSKVKGTANDKDLTKHWGTGMVQSYHQFRTAVYGPSYKIYSKNRPVTQE